MRENKFRKWIRTEIETEAEALEKKAEENTAGEKGRREHRTVVPSYAGRFLCRSDEPD